MHGNVEKSCDMSLENLGDGIGYIDLLLIHCNCDTFNLLISGPIAFKAKEDGVSIASHPDGMVLNYQRESNCSLSSMKNDQTTIPRHGRLWKH